jgi:hypothetical protein
MQHAVAATMRDTVGWLGFRLIRGLLQPDWAFPLWLSVEQDGLHQTLVFCIGCSGDSCSWWEEDILTGSTHMVTAGRENGVAAVPIRSMVSV